MDQFYIRLPSNSSHDYYPDNTTSSFTTKLPDELNLNGRWEVGLKEIERKFLGIILKNPLAFSQSTLATLETSKTNTNIFTTCNFQLDTILLLQN